MSGDKPNPFDRAIAKKTITLPDEELKSKPIPTHKRSRTKSGAKHLVAFHPEELEVIKYVADQQGFSVTSMIRTTTLAKCKDILGEGEYNKMLQAYRDN